MHNMSPNHHIADLLGFYISGRTNEPVHAVPYSKKKSKGDRAFSVVVPMLWKSLPQAQTIEILNLALN